MEAPSLSIPEIAGKLHAIIGRYQQQGDELASEILVLENLLGQSDVATRGWIRGLRTKQGAMAMELEGWIKLRDSLNLCHTCGGLATVLTNDDHEPCRTTRKACYVCGGSGVAPAAATG